MIAREESGVEISQNISGGGILMAQVLRKERVKYGEIKRKVARFQK